MAFALHIGSFNRESFIHVIYRIATCLSHRRRIELSYPAATNPLFTL